MAGTTGLALLQDIFTEAEAKVVFSGVVEATKAFLSGAPVEPDRVIKNKAKRL